MKVWKGRIRMMNTYNKDNMLIYTSPSLTIIFPFWWLYTKTKHYKRRMMAEQL